VIPYQRLVPVDIMSKKTGSFQTQGKRFLDLMSAFMTYMNDASLFSLQNFECSFDVHEGIASTGRKIGRFFAKTLYLANFLMPRVFSFCKRERF